MARTAKDWQALNEQNVAIGNVLLKAMGEMVEMITDQALHIQGQEAKIQKLEGRK